MSEHETNVETTHDTTALDPQNPYESFVVQASAGSGKTYQLSQRFLYLVGAGAEPSRILAVTFTAKAAQEMRLRILAEARALSRSAEKSAHFNARIAQFYANAQKGTLRPPLSAALVAERIEREAERVRVSTIDALYREWCQRFSAEAGSDKKPFPAGARILDPVEADLLRQDAWNRVWQSWVDEPHPPDHPILGVGILKTMSLLRPLLQHEVFLWTAGGGDYSRGFDFHESLLRAGEGLSATQAWENVIGPLRALSRDATPQACALIEAVLENPSIDALVASRLITARDFTVSQTYYRGERRERNGTHIQALENIVQRWVDQERLASLNMWTALCADLFTRFRREYETLKSRREAIEFSDLIKGAFHILSRPEASGAQFLLHQSIEHLMLDEFQDTSDLQWRIFAPIAMELTAGAGLHAERGIASTVFVVGDVKQSIYRFREADPTIMARAEVGLSRHLAHSVGLHRNYRSSEHLLSFVNRFFIDEAPRYPHGSLEGFPHHEAAHEGQDFLIPRHGTLSILANQQSHSIANAKSSASPSSADLATREGEALAQFLTHALSGKDARYAVPDGEGSMRPLRARDCAVLYRNSTHAALFERALRAAGIPCEREEARGFFARQEIFDWRSILTFLALPHDVLNLIATLKTPLLAVADCDALACLEETRDEEPQKRPQAILDLLEPRYPMATHALRSLLARAADVVPAALHRWCVEILRPEDVYREAWGETEAKTATLNLEKFGQMLASRQDESLIACLNSIESAARIDREGAAQGGGEAVSLMTIHKSKGLEWPLVALVGTGESWGDTDRLWCRGVNEHQESRLYFIGRGADAPRYDLGYQRLQSIALSESQNEELRVLYVALTRAKYHLYISGLANAEKPDERAFYGGLRASLAADDALEFPHFCYAVQSCTSTAAAGRARVESSSQVAPIRPVDFPHLLGDLRTATAHSDLGEADEEYGRPETEKGHRLFARLRGLLLHKALEFHVKGRPMPWQRIWQDLVAAADLGVRARLHAHQVCDAMIETTMVEFTRTLASDAWQRITADAQSVRAEVPLAHLRGQTLERGVIDLLVEKSNGELWIVDYKTTDRFPAERFPAPLLDSQTVRIGASALPSEDLLKSTCDSAGYTAQLATYLDMLGSIPGQHNKKVPVIFFTGTLTLYNPIANYIL